MGLSLVAHIFNWISKGVISIDAGINLVQEAKKEQGTAEKTLKVSLAAATVILQPASALIPNLIHLSDNNQLATAATLSSSAAVCDTVRVAIPTASDPSKTKSAKIAQIGLTALCRGAMVLDDISDTKIGKDYHSSLETASDSLQIAAAVGIATLVGPKIGSKIKTKYTEFQSENFKKYLKELSQQLEKGNFPSTIDDRVRNRMKDLIDPKSEYICPITKKPILHPVYLKDAKDDDIVYFEKDALMNWKEKEPPHEKWPKELMPIQESHVSSNSHVRMAIKNILRNAIRDLIGDPQETKEEGPKLGDTEGALVKSDDDHDGEGSKR